MRRKENPEKLASRHSSGPRPSVSLLSAFVSLLMFVSYITSGCQSCWLGGIGPNSSAPSPWKKTSCNRVLCWFIMSIRLFLKMLMFKNTLKNRFFHGIRQGFPPFSFKVHVVLLLETFILIVLWFFTWRHEISLQRNCNSKGLSLYYLKTQFPLSMPTIWWGSRSHSWDLKPLTQICIIGPRLSEWPEDKFFQDSPRLLTAVNFIDFELFIEFKPAEKMIRYLAF